MYNSDLLWWAVHPYVHAEGRLRPFPGREKTLLKLIPMPESCFFYCSSLMNRCPIRLFIVLAYVAFIRGEIIRLCGLLWRSSRKRKMRQFHSRCASPSESSSFSPWLPCILAPSCSPLPLFPSQHFGCFTLSLCLPSSSCPLEFFSLCSHFLFYCLHAEMKCMQHRLSGIQFFTKTHNR